MNFTLIRHGLIALLVSLLLPASLRAASPYGLAADNKIRAQSIVNSLMAEHPELVSAGMHCVRPGEASQSIVASTLNVIGKPSDPPDIDVGQHGETIISPSSKAPKLGVMLPLKDAQGHLIGALALAFQYTAGEDQTRAFLMATSIRDSLQRTIPSLESLFEPTP